MMEARIAELAELSTGRDEVERAIDRWVWYAGFADKLAQALGSSNPVAGPYFNFTLPEPTGVVGLLAPDEPPLLGLVSRLAPALVGGNTVVAVASETGPLAAIELAEVLATSDLPGRRRQPADRLPRRARPVARLAHGRERDRPDRRRRRARADLERAAAENVKRVVHGSPDSQSLYEISAFLELKTVWHPIGGLSETSLMRVEILGSGGARHDPAARLLSAASASRPARRACRTRAPGRASSCTGPTC